MTIFSRRTDWPLLANDLNKVLSGLKQNGTPVLDLTQSNPTHCQFAYLTDDLLKPLARPENLLYAPEPQGLLSAREAVCRYYLLRHGRVFADQVVLTASTSEAYSYLFHLLANPQEKILLPQPSYPLFEYLADLHDVEVDYYDFRYGDGRWTLDFESLERAASSKTRAIALVNPNNPTGAYVTKEELTRLNDFCSARRLSLICDEVFWDYAWGARRDHLSLINNSQTLTFVLSGVSKVLGLPQMKLSWIVTSGPKDLLEMARERLEMIADTYLSVNTPAQQALSDWFSHQDVIQGEIKERIGSNLQFLKSQMRALKGCKLLEAEGGWYAVLEVHDARSDEEWALKLLSKYHVLVHPGYFYDFEQVNHLVISLLPPKVVFQEAILRVISRIEQELE